MKSTFSRFIAKFRAAHLPRHLHESTGAVSRCSPQNVSVEHVQGNRYEISWNMLAQQNGCIQSMLPEASRALERSF